MRVIIQKSSQLVGAWTAAYIAKKINQFKPTAKKPFVLGLPTGSSPLGTYAELIKREVRIPVRVFPAPVECQK